MGRNRIKGGSQREKEREGEREVGEGLRAREEGSREERAEGRGNTSRGTAPRYGKKRQAPRTAHPRSAPMITFTFTNPKVILFTTLSAHSVGDCC